MADRLVRLLNEVLSDLRVITQEQGGSDKDFERVNDPSDVPELLMRASHYLGSLGTGQAATYGDPNTGQVWVALSRLLASTATEATRITKRMKT